MTDQLAPPEPPSELTFVVVFIDGAIVEYDKITGSPINDRILTLLQGSTKKAWLINMDRVESVEISP